MRELKFRVWDNELKTFPFIGFDILGETTVFDVVKQYSLEKITNNTLNIEQYTGLKDKNGVEIYEGDIVSDLYSEYENANFEVYYNEGSFYPLVQVEYNYNSIDKYDPNQFVIIGNIHQNTI